MVGKVIGIRNLALLNQLNGAMKFFRDWLAGAESGK
jgi:hypothetical protein